ncbi:MAG: PTS fructose transporter subunit IIA [Hyphomicrobiales bacterium]|nr:MAG: PTS fructose transporter subunit IIA [Hyphomicrobiales bacterium]
MIGLVLVTHGGLAREFRAALEHIVGPVENMETICIGPEDDMEQRRQDISNAVTRVDYGDGIIILTDMFGGTPSNLAISLLERDELEVIAGINLPMLIKLESVRSSAPLPEAAEQAKNAARNYIRIASKLLAKS